MDRRASRLPSTDLLAASVALLLLASACGSTRSPADGAADGAHDGGRADGGPTDTAGGDAADAPADMAPADMAPADMAPADMAPADMAPADGPIDAGAEAPSDGSLADVPGDGSLDLSGDGSPDLSGDGSPEAGDAPDGAPADGDGLVCEGVAVAGSHLVLEFDSKNAEWVRTLRWRASTGTLTSNINASGGNPGCTGVSEFFGQAFAAPEGNSPSPVGGNNLASVTGCGTFDQTIVSQSPDCANAAQIPVTTVYHFYDGAKADQVRVTRTIGFDASTGMTTGVGMRVFVPRVHRDTFANVLIPNGAGTAVTTSSVSLCPDDCFTATGASWNGQWFADVDPTSGLAMIVLRDPTMTTGVSLTVNNDSNSMSNLSSFVVLQPTGGWTAPITEIEYLCFADLTTWPQASRDAAILPSGCGP